MRRLARMIRRGTGREAGVASIELLGMIPLVFLFAALGLQVGAFLWAVTNTNEAARQGARAQSLGQDGCGAANATLATSLDVISCNASGGKGMYTPSNVTLVVKVPVLDLVDDYVPEVEIKRSAYLP